MDRKGRLAGIAITGLILLPCLAAASGVYQWRDAQGRLHFGDQPPEGHGEDLSSRYQQALPFDIVIEGVDYAVSPALRDRLATAVRRLFSIYRHDLGIDYSREREFRIRIHGTEASFRRYQRQVAPNLENAAGFYHAGSNQITTWAIPDERALLALITHECAHAIAAANPHRIPAWLDEGLAEYFELMELHGLSADIPLNPHWLRVLRQHGYPQHGGRLATLMRAPYPQWYAANGPNHLSYAASWSLVWYLMDSREGRQLLSTLLRTPHPQPSSSEHVIERHWPGGMAALEQQWQSWLLRAQGKHRY